MVDHNLLHRELADLAGASGPDFDLHEGLHRLSLTAAAALELDGAGITLQIPGQKTQFLAAADPVTMHVERAQDALQEGACVDAIRRSEVVAIGDLAIEQPWPNFGPVVLEAGFHAVAGVPIRYLSQSIGAVNLYAKGSRPWTTDEFVAGRLLAELAAGYLVNNELLRRSLTLNEQLQAALDSRVVIEQAKGMLAVRHGISTEAAFEVIRTYARSQRAKLHDIARGVVAGSVDVPQRETLEQEEPNPS